MPLEALFFQDGLALDAHMSLHVMAVAAALPGAYIPPEQANSLTDMDGKLFG
jgi:hypothetical protein